MRSFLVAAALLAGLGTALAQPPAPTAAPVDISLSAADQSDIRAICALAIKSPLLTDPDAVISVGEFCARLRGTIIEAGARKAAAPAAPKE